MSSDFVWSMSDLMLIIYYRHFWFLAMLKNDIILCCHLDILISSWCHIGWHPSERPFLDEQNGVGFMSLSYLTHNVMLNDGTSEFARQVHVNTSSSIPVWIHTPYTYIVQGYNCVLCTFKPCLCIFSRLHVVFIENKIYNIMIVLSMVQQKQQISKSYPEIFVKFSFQAKD